MRNLLSALGAALALLCFDGPAQAAPVFTYRFDQSSYTVGVGETVDVQVYLRETRQFFDTSLLAEGLFSAGVFLSFTDSSSSQVAQVLSAGDIHENPAFNDPFSPLTVIDPTRGAGMLENVSLLNIRGVPPTVIDPLTSEVYLGTFTFTALEPGTAHIRAGDFSPGDDTLTFRFGTVLDSRISPADVSITAVPEPSALVLLSTGLPGLGGRPA